VLMAKHMLDAGPHPGTRRVAGVLAP
jgi:hypothetical protein